MQCRCRNYVHNQTSLTGQEVNIVKCCLVHGKDGFTCIAASSLYHKIKASDQATDELRHRLYSFHNRKTTASRKYRTLELRVWGQQIRTCTDRMFAAPKMLVILLVSILR